jgi:hypothetical protein
VERSDCGWTYCQVNKLEENLFVKAELVVDGPTLQRLEQVPERSQLVVGN